LASSCYLISGELPEEYHPEFTLKKLTRSSSSGRKSQSRAATVHISFSASSFAVKRTIFQTCSWFPETVNNVTTADLPNCTTYFSTRPFFFKAISFISV
jgi:hypothetical protein